MTPAPASLLPVTSRNGRMRHYKAAGMSETLCHGIACGPDVFTSHGRLTQVEIDALPLCRRCKRMAADAA